MTLLLIYLFTALIISFLCSIMEAVLLTTPLTYLKINENTNQKGIKKMIKYRYNVEKPLSAILSLNTIAHTVGAAGVGAQGTEVFGDAYFGIISAILTILILVLTEILPKTIGANFWRNLTNIVGHTIQITVLITYPLVIFSAFITHLISKNKVEQTTSRQEISALAEIGTTEGIFLEKENKIIQNLIKLQNIRVTEIMTPRTVVVIANENMSLAEFLKNKSYLKFSRIPVFSESIDNISGYILRQRVFEKLAENNNDLKLKDIIKQIVFVLDTKPVLKLWEELLDKKEHIALVVDEYGGMDGIVTMEDIIETLLGFEIVDEKDTIADMQQFARERWKQRQAKYKLMNLEDNS